MVCSRPKKALQNNFLYSNSETVKFRPDEPQKDKNCDKDEFNDIKTAISYPPNSALCKTSYVNFLRLAQITEKLIILSRLCLPLT